MIWIIGSADRFLLKLPIYKIVFHDSLEIEVSLQTLLFFKFNSYFTRNIHSHIEIQGPYSQSSLVVRVGPGEEILRKFLKLRRFLLNLRLNPRISPFKRAPKVETVRRSEEDFKRRKSFLRRGENGKHAEICD